MQMRLTHRSGSSMGNCGTAGRVWLTLFLMLTAVDQAHSSGQVNLQFLRFSSDGRTASGSSCQGGGSAGRCNPQFRLTLEKETKGGKSVFVYQQPDYYVSQDTIDFVSVFGDRPNPLVVALNYDDNQGRLWLEINVTDIVGGKSGDLIGKFTALLQVSGTEVRYLELKSEPNQSLTLRYWFKCTDNYYGSLCNKHCKGSNDNNGEHSWCDSDGDKLCRYGWIDPSTSCKKPHPCRTCVCQNGGVCVPQGSEGYRCQCPTGFSGNDCEKCHLQSSQCGRTSETAGSCDLLPIQQNVVVGISVGALVGAIFGSSAFGAILVAIMVCCCCVIHHNSRRRSDLFGHGYSSGGHHV